MSKKVNKLENESQDPINQSENKNPSLGQNNRFLVGIKNIFATLWRWTKRVFYGPGKELDEANIFNVERIDSPSKMLVKNFFSRRLAVGALIVFLAMFVFVFAGPLFIPFSETYQDVNQAGISPNFSMMSVSREVSKNYKHISSYSSFTVGLSGDGNVSIWGHTLLGASKIDIAIIPEAVKEANILFVSAGNDHIVAIDDKGIVYAWGISSNGQYGEGTGMPDRVDIANVKSLTCGNQGTIIIMKDGSVHVWGNTMSVTNLNDFIGATNIESAAFLNSSIIVLTKAGKFDSGNKRIVESVNGEPNSNITNYLSDKVVVSIASTASTVAFLLDTGEIVTSGNFNYNENLVPELENGERFVFVGGGNRHYVATTSNGNIYAWGSNYLGQCKVPNYGEFDEIVVGSFQNYIIRDNEVVGKWGLKGYLFGTDDFGRDVFARIVYGGRMTMTVGAVSVIVSSIIALIIGCLSGYFGGWVDMLLMRITEIFAAIPFLPFAMLLSLVLRTASISETGRIVMIMVVLGLLSWTGLARIVRGQVLAEREKEFVISAKSMGIKESRIAFKHILPNVISIALVNITLGFASCMLIESSLSYLGFGVAPPKPTWGNMLAGSNNSIVIQTFWWRWVFPALFLAVATICINIVGDALRDVMDPKSGER